MKTTLEIPDTLFRKAKATAAQRGQSLKQLVTEAIRENLRNGNAPARTKEPGWIKFFGMWGKTPAMRAENRRVEKLIEAEFEQIEPEDCK